MLLQDETPNPQPGKIDVCSSHRLLPVPHNVTASTQGSLASLTPCSHSFPPWALALCLLCYKLFSQPVHSYDLLILDVMIQLALL